MALSFNQTKGKAQKSSVESYTYKDGENRVRLVGGVLPRYVYWVKGTNNKDIPIECLAFSREKEKFDNLEVDHVPHYHPDLKCSWSYAVNCIDPTDGKVKVLNLKKKLFEQIMSAAEDLGDPTDFTTGWDIVFKRSKTGPLTFNVSYDLNVLRCKPRALTPEELAVAEVAVDIDTKYPRATPDEQKALLEKLAAGAEEEEAGNASEQESIKELG
jgi:hypothetical protein